MPQPALDHSDEQSAIVVGHLERLSILSEIGFERPLTDAELQELGQLRSDLRTFLAAWLQKR